MVTRYATDHFIDAQFEPGSRGRVLKNLLGIRGKRQMDAREALHLEAATDWAIRHVAADQRFTANDNGAQLRADGGNIQAGSRGQRLAFPCGQFAGSRSERAFSRFFHAFNGGRGQHVGT